MNNMAAMMSSATEKWDTPPDLVADLATVFDWYWDVCASGPNVCHYYFDEQMNGLAQDWCGLCWMNPPYGREIGRWVEKARRAGDSDNATIVCLVPARTDTKWWQGNVPYASLVVFVSGRLKFGNAENGAPFPSAFVVFGQINEAQREKLAAYGWTTP